MAKRATDSRPLQSPFSPVELSLTWHLTMLTNTYNYVHSSHDCAILVRTRMVSIRSRCAEWTVKEPVIHNSTTAERRCIAIARRGVWYRPWSVCNLVWGEWTKTSVVLGSYITSLSHLSHTCRYFFVWHLELNYLSQPVWSKFLTPTVLTRSFVTLLFATYN
jgi:hypothetical protein